MGIFRSKEQKDLELAVNHLNQFLIDYFDNWSKHLYRMISAKAASENPLNKVEPFMRIVWIEAYKSGIQLLIESEKRYELVSIKTPQIGSVITREYFMQAASDQGRRIGESVGQVAKEICDIHPDWFETLKLHVEEPVMSELKSKAKVEMADYLNSNRNYFS